VAMPITTAVYQLLQGSPAGEVVSNLLARPLAAEGPAA